MQKLLSVAIPCYNSQDYVRKAIESVLPGKDRVEIIVVDDGSTDDTAAIGDEYAAKYPGIVKVVRKENGGHGDAVMTGVANATGLYFRVLDSDDWLDKESLEKVLAVLDKMDKENDAVDLLITNYVYEKVNEGRRKQIHYRKNLPVNRKFTWDEVGKWATGSYILMHSATYRTELVRKCNMVLPKHTFYVDHLYVCHPMMKVQTMYYIDVDLYRYFIGRDDQSVNEKVMLSRMDQQVRVNRLLLSELDTDSLENKKQRDYINYYVEIVTMATITFYLRAGGKENEKKMEDFMNEIKETKPSYFDLITSFPTKRHPLRSLRYMPKWLIYPLYRFGYSIVRRVFDFN